MKYISNKYTYTPSLASLPPQLPPPHPTPVGHRRQRAPCAVEQVSTSYLSYTLKCVPVSPNLPVQPVWRAVWSPSLVLSCKTHELFFE